MNLPIVSRLGACNDSTAQITWRQLDCPSPGTWRGVLRGPFNAHARTLAAEFRLSPEGETLVTEPCYWTPETPFLYKLVATRVQATGDEHDVHATIGLRRLRTRGVDCLWENRRVVLRGARVAHVESATLADARSWALALLIDGIDDACCAAAAEVGVALLADLRGIDLLTGFSWPSPADYPAVAAVVVDRQQLPDDFQGPPGAMLAQAVYTEGAPEIAEWADLLVTEFADGQRPPSWLATAAWPAKNGPLPTLGVQTAAESQPLEHARRRCDQLQRRLAPDFDLSGYFA